MGEGKDNMASLMGTRRLADAVRAAKIAAAHRSDVVVDIREAERARLELLVDELQPLLAELPKDDELFDLTLSGGLQPRFWVDVTAHVTMARDRRTYRFVRETRLGRVTLAESTEQRLIAERIVDYVADRIVEREKALALPAGLIAQGPEREEAPRPAEAPAPVPAPAAQSDSGGFAVGLAWFMIGVVVGAAILMAVAHFRGFSPY